MFDHLVLCMKEKNYLDILTKGQELSLHKDIKGIQFWKYFATYLQRKADSRSILWIYD